MARGVAFFSCCLLAAAGLVVAPFLIFRYAPVEETMGFVQKIFYFHVPCAWSGLLGALICGGAGAVYLFSRGRRGDALGAATAELTVLFGALMLITGPLWARIAWGHYWVWDVRLTTALLLFLLFLGVLLARRYSGPTSRRVAAALALFGAADVPLIYISVKLWEGQHPKTSVVPTLGPKMRLAFWISMASITLVFFVLLQLRLALERQRRQLDRIAVQLEERELEVPRG